MTDAEERHPDGWVSNQITDIAAKVRDWLDRNNPDASRQLFNSDLEGIAILVWPDIYQAGRNDERA